jgi:hypothetical protein
MNLPGSIIFLKIFVKVMINRNIKTEVSLKGFYVISKKERISSEPVRLC